MAEKMARKGKGKRKEIGVPGSIFLILLLIIAFSLGYYGLTHSALMQTQVTTTGMNVTKTLNTNTSTITAENLTSLTISKPINKTT